MKALVKFSALVIMLVAFVGFSASAASAKGKEKKSHKKTTVFSAEEIALGIALDSFYEDLVEDAEHVIAQDITPFDRVEVYDSKGHLVKELDVKGRSFSELMIPPKAERIMIDNRVAYYLIAE